VSKSEQLALGVPQHRALEHDDGRTARHSQLIE
jgi:hypothetical protein